MKRLYAAVLAVLVAPALAMAQHEHHGGAPMKDSSASATVGAQGSSSSSSSTGSSSGTSMAVSGAEGSAKKAGLHMGVELDHSLGSGTLVDSRYYAAFAGGLGLSPSYAFSANDIKLSASAKASLSWEYTLPDNETGRRVSYSDIRLGIAAPGLFTEKNTGIGASLNFGLVLPISPESRTASTITQLSLGASLSRSFFEKLDVGYRVSVGRGIHGSGVKLTTVSSDRDELGNLIRVCRTDEQYCGSFGNNTAWSLSNTLSVGYEPLEKLSLALSWTIANSWKYGFEDDRYTPKTVDSNGNPAARVGTFRAPDKTTASLGAAYALDDSLEVSFGIGTEGPTRTMDGKRFRFPFFDFVSQADSLTSYSLTLSATF